MFLHKLMLVMFRNEGFQQPQSCFHMLKVRKSIINIKININTHNFKANKHSQGSLWRTGSLVSDNLALKKRNTSQYNCMLYFIKVSSGLEEISFNFELDILEKNK